jgi:hypothetical protein
MPKLVSGFVWFSKKPITRYYCYVTGVGVSVSNLSVSDLAIFLGTCQIYCPGNSVTHIHNFGCWCVKEGYIISSKKQSRRTCAWNIMWPELCCRLPFELQYQCMETPRPNANHGDEGNKAWYIILYRFTNSEGTSFIFSSSLRFVCAMNEWFISIVFGDILCKTFYYHFCYFGSQTM